MERNNLLMYLLLAVALLIIALPLAGCTSSGSIAGTTAKETTAAATTAGGAGAKNEISIQENAFSPDNLSIKVGDTVNWTNNDSYAHTVKAAKGEFDSGKIASGGKFSFTFDKEGTYEYMCAIHTFMKGTVTVTK